MNLQKLGEEAQDKIGMKDAAMFPVYASGGLFGIYLFFKVIELSREALSYAQLKLPHTPQAKI
jgi:minor histocompatibility antigen H13